MKEDKRPLFPEQVFPEGIYFKLPHENHPSFVKGRIDIDVEKMKLFLDSIPDTHIRLDCLESKMGNGYLKIVKQQKKYSYREESVKKFEKADSDFSIDKNTKEDDLPF
tara:strand:- start:1859 stop:2182 length:324 start_codon:yes stop_codon:yes gene_type:complete